MSKRNTHNTSTAADMLMRSIHSRPSLSFTVHLEFVQMSKERLKLRGVLLIFSIYCQTHSFQLDINNTVCLIFHFESGHVYRLNYPSEGGNGSRQDSLLRPQRVLLWPQVLLNWWITKHTATTMYTYLNSKINGTGTICCMVEFILSINEGILNEYDWMVDVRTTAPEINKILCFIYFVTWSPFYYHNNRRITE